ncbi:MAG: hypothetical protein PQJ58_08515 [Spirochaetales bacterium]|nr:hypothetical protein [Spirochaetales bacterium]
MKNRLFIFLFLLILVFPSFVPAQNNSIDNLLFSMTVKDLNELGKEELNSLAESGDWLLLDGSIAGMTLYSGKDEEYLLDVLLMQGEWMGLEEVRKYDCHLIFQGEKWREIIPDKTPRKPAPGQILLNARVLVLAQVLGYEEGEEGLVCYLMVDQIRELP